ncbi:VanW family protein [Paenisporosarcina sp. TG-14]|uniref:VanW family protein n=1 Tax=Paenisporosarcina sp. TG-14 TaxID=1231057 RepID=UPI0002DEDA47|nr:VanW family protein [Paenisporosarcina sp. TG-14]
MNNKLFGTTIAALLGSSVLFFGVTQAGTYVINDVIFASKEFGDQTYIGPFDVSNLPEEEAAVTVQTGVKGWYDKAQVKIKLQDAIVPFPLEVVEFNTDSTLTSAQDGAKNELQFDVAEESVGTFLNQQFAPFVFSDEEIASATEAIRIQLASGRNNQTIDISSALFASTTIEATVSNVTFDTIETSVGIQNLLLALDGYAINSLTTFSLLDFIETADVGIVTEQDLTTVASILYASVLQTNFGVDERSIGPTVPASVPLGFEATINRELGVDFVFTNPNSTTFTLNFNNVGTSLNASITGLPLIYSYQTTLSNQEEYSPKTIKQYSSFVNQNTIRLKIAGANGVQVTVIKTIMSGEDVLETINISKDFYPPVHKVEVHPLTVIETAPAEGSGDGTTTDGTGTTPDDGTTGSTDGSTSQPSTDNGNGTSDNGSSTGGSGSGNDSGTKNDPTSDDTDPEYDKGGNVIPPSK